MVFNLFKKSSFPKLESFYLQQNHQEELNKYPWTALAVNERTISESMLTKELVLTGENTVSFQMAETKTGLIHHVFQGKTKIFSGELTNDLESKNTRVLFNNLLDAVIEKEMRFFQEKMNQSEFSPRQLEAEEKALEWMRVSFEVLTKGILESLTNPEYLFQTRFFCGVNPKTKAHEMRLMTFNLDMTFYLLPDNNLRIMIYNNKPNTVADKPVLSGDYSFRKREMFDQFVGLLSVISKGIHA